MYLKVAVAAMPVSVGRRYQRGHGLEQTTSGTDDQ